MDDERLIVALEARIRDFERNMAKAERRGTKTYTGLRRGSKVATTAMERDMLGSTRRINQALATTSTRIGSFGKAFAAA
ncbi:MAG: phage tail tape-measure protein, partial [Parvibaculum sp.]